MKQEETTFESILEANKAVIYRICRIYAVGPIEPQDLFQEVVFQLWKAFDSFEGRASVKTWVYRVALNVCMRSKLKAKRMDQDMVRLDAIQFEVAEPVSEDQAAKFEALRKCIALLKEVDRTLVILYLEDQPYKTIASVMGLTENHVAVKMKRIRKLLLDCITSKI